MEENSKKSVAYNPLLLLIVLLLIARHPCNFSFFFFEFYNFINQSFKIIDFFELLDFRLRNLEFVSKKRENRIENLS